MKAIMLGCGTSVGVPSLGVLGWGSCDPSEPKNRRQRSALLIEKNGFHLLIDAGPDIRNQLLAAGNPQIDAVLITHTHSDHIAGLDDLRSFYLPDRIKTPLYCTEITLQDLTQRFPFLFSKNENSPSYFEPSLEAITINYGDQITLGNIDIKILQQYHGNKDSLGFVFDGVFGYSTDVVDMPEESFEALKDLECWIVEALRPNPHQAHAHFDLAFEWIARLKPKRAILTHLGIEADYAKTLALCPKGVEPGYDGLTLSF